MKVYIDRNATLEILSADPSLYDAKKLIENLPSTTVSEDGKIIFQSCSVNPQIDMR